MTVATPDYGLMGCSAKTMDNEGSSSSVSSASSVSAGNFQSGYKMQNSANAGMAGHFQRSASSPSMNHCWQLKTGVTSHQPVQIMKNKKQSSLSKDDTDLSPDDIIVDPKTHQTYRKGRLIGKGGFAKVYEVTRLSPSHFDYSLTENENTVLADKIIDKEVFTRRSTSKDKVKREIVLHRDLIHPNIVRFNNFFNDADNNVHILLEYCSQKSLLHVMKNRKVLTEPEVRYYMMQICEGVRYLHRKSILHRDLKLGNMFLTWDMTVKIGDFGLATQHQASLSSVSTLCGTPNYIAPEVLKKQGHSYEADIWALGCMMFAMLVGTPPFETKSLGRTYAKIAANEYDIPERLSPSAQSFISMLLHPDPKNRGHLHQAGHPADLLSHPFFLSGFCPRKLPQNAASVPPTFPLDTVLNENHIYALASSSASGNSSSSASGNPQSIDSDYSAISTNLDNSNSPTVSNKFRTTLRQKFSQMFTPTASCIMQQPHSAAGNATADLLLQPPPFAQYRPADHLISHIIEALEQWISRRPSVLAGGNEAAAELLLSPISVVPVFVSKWIDYSNKYGFGYQLSDKTVGVLFNEGTRICQTVASSSSEKAENQCFEFTDMLGKSVAWRSSSPPPSFIDLNSRLKLLDYFARYMEENLAEGVILSLCANQMKVSTRHRSVIPQVVRWTRNPSAVIMELNNGSVQINFIRDHAKVIFWGVDHSSLLLTYMATDKAPITYNLQTLPRLMPSAASNHLTNSISPLLTIDQKISQSLLVLRDLAQNLQSVAAAAAAAPRND